MNVKVGDVMLVGKTHVRIVGVHLSAPGGHSTITGGLFVENRLRYLAPLHKTW